ncbi:MAG: hypothetical protein RIS86_1811 [Planctomycetota bacterium]
MAGEPSPVREVRSARFVYAVRARFADAATRARFVSWLVEGHLADVVRAGAEEAELVDLAPTEDSPFGDVEARYRFADQAAFERYESGPAVALRAEGRERFPPEAGVAMTRSTGMSRVSWRGAAGR